jgi:copper chaperone NosL
VTRTAVVRAGFERRHVMREPIQKFWEFLARPIDLRARAMLAGLIVPLALSFAFPLWNISMKAPQYPNGLTLDIYVYKVEGGNEGQHIQEINTLNHYIGMAPINREQLSDLGWMPFAIGLLILLTLRCAAIGDVRILVDLAVLSTYVSLFSLGRFLYRMYVLGHNLDPHAPMRIAPFTPAIFGTKQIANFTVTSYPRGATVMIAGFVTGVCLVSLWVLMRGRSEALRQAQTMTS